MKRFLTLSFWAVGFTGAVLFACFWFFGLIYVRKHWLAVLAMIAFGLYLAWVGIKTFLEEKRNPN